MSSILHTPFSRLHGVLLLLLLITIPSALHAKEKTIDLIPEPAPQTSPDEAKLTTYFDATLVEIQEIIAGQKETATLVVKTLETLTGTTTLLEQELRQIKGMTRIVKGRPYETRGILQDLRSLRKKSTTMLMPAEALLKELKTKDEKVNLLATETGRPWTKELPESLQETLKGLKKALQGAARHLAAQEKNVQKALEHARSFDTQTQETLTVLEKALPGFWKRLLFTSSGQLFSRDLWQGATDNLKGWLHDLPTFLRIQLPSGSYEWVDWAGKFLLYWLLLLALAALTLQRATFALQTTVAENRRGIYTAWFWVSLSLALLGTFFTTGSRQTSLQLTLIHLSLFYGVMRITWTGRILGQEAPGSSPLKPFFVLFAGATILQLLALPQLFARLIWMACILLSFVMGRKQTPVFLLEKGLALINPVVCVGLFILAFVGWPDLSMLLAELWALMVLFLELETVATRLLRASVEKLPATLIMTILKGIAVGFGAPFLWVLGLSGITGWLTMHLGSDFVFQRISSMNLSWGEYSFNFFRIVIIIVLFYLTHSFGNIWGQILDQKYFRWSRLDPGIIASLRTTGGYAIWIVSGIIAFNIMGIRLTSLAVIAGGLSVGIGFGLQNLINNFISGLILLFGRTIQAGDVIQITDLWGTVRRVNIRNTEIQTFDNSIIFVPNSELISSSLTNWTHKNDFRLRREMLVGVAYGSDVDLVKKTLHEVAMAHPHVLENPAPSILFKAFGASSLDFALRVWIDHIDYSLSTLSDLHEATNRAFAQAGIEISFPQMDIHVRDSVPFSVTP